jgi:hypothetical protein
LLNVVASYMKGARSFGQLAVSSMSSKIFT